MKISARNQLKGKILEVKKGATTAHVRLEIAPGQVITSSITNEAVDELGLKVGGSADRHRQSLKRHDRGRVGAIREDRDYRHLRSPSALPLLPKSRSAATNSNGRSIKSAPPSPVPICRKSHRAIV